MVTIPIYIPPTSHTHHLLTTPTSNTHRFHPLSKIVIHTSVIHTVLKYSMRQKTSRCRLMKRNGTGRLTVIGRQLIICAFACGRRCARLIICYGRRYLERTCVECGNGGWLEETMQQMRRAVIKKALSIVRKLKEDSESTR